MYYYTPGGLELITPNKELAFARAAEHGSEVYYDSTTLSTYLNDLDIFNIHLNVSLSRTQTLSF